MIKSFFLFLTGLLLHNLSCSGSPVFLKSTEDILQQEFIQQVINNDDFREGNFSIPEGLTAKESTGIVLKENKRLVAALLTLSLGMLGVHRIYLGSKPWIPLVYLLTFGGGFFILPLIDLIAILTTPDIDKYVNNPRVFMWIDPEASKSAEHKAD